MRKDQGIESLRGVAVLLMVAGHVVGSTGAYGLTVPDDSWWRFSYLALEDVRMPLFAALSGFVYAYRPVRSPDGTRRLLRGKVRRLLVPYLTVGAAFALVQMVTPGTNYRPDPSELPGDFLQGVAHLWFLQALFLIFALVGALDAFRLLGSWRGWAAVTVAACVLALLRVPDDLAVFSLNGALRLLPFFLLGYGAHAHAGRLLRPRVQLAAAGLFVPVYGLRLWTILAADADLAAMVGRALSLAVAVLIVVVMLAVRDRLRSSVLAWIGGFSFGIYLLHVFGTAGARIAGTALGLDNTALLFLLGMVAGIGLPIVFEVLLGRYALVSWAVLGQKPRRTEATRLDTVRAGTA